jgi:hypothetical protein
MKEKIFAEYLKGRGFSEEKIILQIKTIKELEKELQGRVQPWKFEDLNYASTQSFVDDLIDQSENSLENLLAMARYAKAIQNDEMFLCILPMLDGCEVMENLHKKLGDYVGEDLREIVFEGMPLPPLGLSGRDKSLYTYRILNRMMTIFDESTCREIIGYCLRDLPEIYYQDDKVDFYENSHQEIDEFLILKGKRFLTTLETCQKNGELFFGQKITDKVLDFVKQNPEIGQGVRNGDVIYETKIPYDTLAYLAEDDPVRKRYHYCHCPWARESLLKKAFVVPSIFCQCSAGFHKRRYEIIFGQPIQAKVVNSVLKGDLFCRFEIHLPD